jgi:hypothetical protein
MPTSGRSVTAGAPRPPYAAVLREIEAALDAEAARKVEALVKAMRRTA